MLIACVSVLDIDDTNVAKRFLRAARYHDVNAIVHMLRGGVLVDCCNENYRTALHWAARNNCIGVVNVLLESRANVDPKDRLNVTPLMEAAFMNNTNVMEMLLHHVADRSVVDKRGLTALDIARRHSHEEAIRLLKKY